VIDAREPHHFRIAVAVRLRQGLDALVEIEQQGALALVELSAKVGDGVKG